MTFGRWCFWINDYPDGSKVSRLDTLRQVEKSTGKTPAELQNAPKLSGDHSDAWEAFTNLKEYTYSEIEAYMRVTGYQLDPWEVDAIMQLAKYKDAKPVWPLNM